MSTVAEGLAHQQAGRAAEAVASFQAVLRRNPLDFDALHLLGLAMQDLGQPERAEALLQAALRVRPESALAHGNLGQLMVALGRHDEGEAAYREALKLNPRFAEAHYNLGNIRRIKGDPQGAAAAYRQALGFAPELKEAWENLATVTLEVGSYEEARRAADRLSTIGATPAQRLRAALMMPIVPADPGQILWARRNLQDEILRLRAEGVRFADPYRDVGMTSFYLAYHGLSDRPLQEALAGLYLEACPDLAWSAPHCEGRRRPGGRRPRIGLVSAYFSAHTIGKLYLRLVELWNRDRFELILFRAGSDGSDIARRFDAAADRVVHLPADLAEARRVLAEAEADLLFYPDIGMNLFTYFLAYARLAPVQCVSWGHPDSTGIPNLDYFISSDMIEPEGSEAEYSERLVKLRRVPACYGPPTIPPPADRAYFDLPEGRHLYVCGQATFKFHPDFDAVLAAILRADPKGLVVLTTGRRPEWTERLLARIARGFPDIADRVRLVRRMSQEDYLRLQGLADVALDPPQFGGGNSSYEIFQAGTPIIASLAPFMRGRPTFGMYRQMDIPDLVARDSNHYAQLAVRAAGDRDWRADIVRRIGERKALLYDDREVVAEFEDFFEQAIQAAYSR